MFFFTRFALIFCSVLLITSLVADAIKVVLTRHLDYMIGATWWICLVGLEIWWLVSLLISWKLSMWLKMLPRT